MFIFWLLVWAARIGDQQAIVQEHKKHTTTQHHEVGDLPFYVKNILKFYEQCVVSYNRSKGTLKNCVTVYKNIKFK